MNIHSINTGDCFSESSHYKVKQINRDNILFEHIESGQEVTLSNEYLQLLKHTQFESVVIVGKEDKLWTGKQVDDFVIANPTITPPLKGSLRLKGIRTIFQEIYDTTIFQVTFKKQDKPLTQKEFKRRKEEQITKGIELIEKTAASKKGVAEIAKKVLSEIQENPIYPYDEGEMRVLRGYKLEFVSVDGKYDCVDLDIVTTDKESNIRQVNINNIVELIVNNVKYVLEK